jgi:peptidoglycan/LPS O-acetylase OafA/YrhL
MENIALHSSRRAAARSINRVFFMFRHIWSKRSPVPTILVPSFLHKKSGGSSNKVAPTAWLDGMRGIAAFFVYIRHFSAITHPNIQPGFGSSDSNRWIIQLPFLRLLISGPSMVALFFIISGYALSWGPLRALHLNGSPEQSLNRLSSATFRRATRLFLPGIASTFMIMICISLGMYDRGQRAFESDVDMPGFHEPQPPQFRNDPFNVQFWDWVNSTWKWLNIWGVSGHPYNPHLWTLSVEFRCSIALFVVLVALARTKAIWRLSGLGTMVIYCYYTNAWSEWMFFAGGFLAQLRLLQEGRQDKWLHEATSSTNAAEKGVDMMDDNAIEVKAESWVRKISAGDAGRYILFILGLYLLSNPDGGYGK